ncbi:hypothetical protein BDV39DRAFT_187883 [Aspergillus sergii]|uniref:Uncharacterized protein n=1 Tax=Aspergillus sergii TaxID=1034303 RepID=A0A5N6WHW9_9EURO|nr:hypothetical protein BDV39DRAFT_187883 [Aspergillus sergii]
MQAMDMNNTKLAVFLMDHLTLPFIISMVSKRQPCCISLLYSIFLPFYYYKYFVLFFSENKKGGKERDEDRTVLRTTYGVYQKYIPQYPLHFREERKQAE